MKVGTDAILLGAWATADNPARILDVGTGTGVIALMMAQRFSGATVMAVDVNPSAVQLADENFRNSPWADRCAADRCAVQDFDDGHFDLIVSNPPWFRDSLKPDEKSRTLARHDDSLPTAELFGAAARLLSGSGRFCVVIPFKDEECFCHMALDHGFHPCRCTFVRPTPHKPPKRTLLEFSFDAVSLLEETELVVEVERHQYTPEYAELTQDFLRRAAGFV